MVSTSRRKRSFGKKKSAGSRKKSARNRGNRGNSKIVNVGKPSESPEGGVKKNIGKPRPPALNLGRVRSSRLADTKEENTLMNKDPPTPEELKEYLRDVPEGLHGVITRQYNNDEQLAFRQPDGRVEVGPLKDELKRKDIARNSEKLQARYESLKLKRTKQNFGKRYGKSPKIK